MKSERELCIKWSQKMGVTDAQLYEIHLTLIREHFNEEEGLVFDMLMKSGFFSVYIDSSVTTTWHLWQIWDSLWEFGWPQYAFYVLNSRIFCTTRILHVFLNNGTNICLFHQSQSNIVCMVQVRPNSRSPNCFQQVYVRQKNEPHGLGCPMSVLNKSLSLLSPHIY